MLTRNARIDVLFHFFLYICSELFGRDDGCVVFFVFFFARSVSIGSHHAESSMRSMDSGLRETSSSSEGWE